MNDEISTEEQEQVKHIISRWRKVNLKSAIPLLFASFVLIRVTPQWYQTHLLVAILAWTHCAPPLISRWKVKKVVRSLSEEEREMLARSANMIEDSVEKEAVRKALQHYRAHPQKELLRPSEKKDDNTLLRAATQTDDTAQEQLLRPTQSHDIL